MRLARREFGRLGGFALAGGLLLRGGRAWADHDVGQADAVEWLDPELRPAARLLVAKAARTLPLGDATLAQRRKEGAASVVPPLPDIPVAQHRIAGRGSQPPVTVYAINAQSGSSRPAILHTHGGGHVLGQARYELRYLQELARDLDCLVVTVEYRLAPETRFAGSVEDNYTALRWLHGTAATLGIDRDRIALLGESAGGTHAALLAIAARDRREIPVAFQALIYPMLDDRTGSGNEPVPAHIGQILWGTAQNRYGWRSFLGTEPGTGKVPVAGVPARTVSLAGLPPAFIAVGAADLFVHEDIDFAQRLIGAAVPVELLVVPGAFHAFDRVAPDAAISKRFREAKMEAFRRAFA